ncbi:tigger transposable element-derived protein 2-like [Osmia bicornis bicornis]|uniref:tigger transposable element-derived protein 2-like n=2 Tax=Osmia bicornis bicornis TaxID=1437191 RepID=UPI001EAF3D7A|nr:tigger transposable element-derived protein 2-like [Osmia bicornis bicornis]
MAEIQKKKRVFLSVEQKMQIAEQLQKGMTVKALSREYGVSPDVIHRIRRECTLLSAFGTRGGHVLQHKNRRRSSVEDLEERLYTWFVQQRVMGNPITDLLLLEKAREMLAAHGGTSYAGSKGWLWRFKQRYAIHLAHAHGEKASADKDGAQNFIKTFNDKIAEEDINLNLVFNMDEAGLLWKTIPSKSLITDTESKLEGRKLKKDRVSICFCSNATGTHKLAPIFIHKFQNPRALKNCRNLPVVYKSQRQAWMTQEIFNSWYEEHFKPSVEMYKTESGMLGKVVLLVDNCSSHKTMTPQAHDNFEIIYLPPNTTSLIQPMDQGVIAKFKTTYRHKMLRRVLQYEQGIQEFYCKFNIKDCINLVAESWTDITSANLHASWNKLFCRESEQIDICNTSIHSEMTDIINALTGENNDSEELNTVLTHLEEQEAMNYEDDSTAMEIERSGNEEEEKAEEHDDTQQIQPTEAERIEK